MKKIIALILAMMMLLAACGNSAAPAPAATEAPKAETPAAPEAPAAPAEAVEFNGKLVAPFAVTSCGQSPGATMLNVVANQAKLASVNDNAMTVENLPAETKTLIITTGTSGKGMGAAGTDVKMELERCVALAEAAKAAGMLVCCAHVEGMSRRTDANDAASIDGILAIADVVLVIEDSDSDGYFTNYCSANNLPLLKVAVALNAAEVME
jgi:nucleoid-associated protein YgaU